MVNHITSSQNIQVQKLISLKNSHNVSVGLHLEFNNTSFNEEIQKQYDTFKNLFNFNPSHLDIHKPTELKKKI